MKRSVLVIGGTGGIGSATVQRFAAAGDDVLFTYLRAADSARRLEQACQGAGGSTEGVQLDVRRDEGIGAVVERSGPGLETVIFAAASGVARPLHKARRKHWDWTFNINVRAFFVLYQCAFDVLAANRGSMVVFSSLGSQRVLPGYSLIGATKATLEALVRYAAVEAAPVGVRVNTVAPGAVDTRAIRALGAESSSVDCLAGSTPMGRLVTPSDVAELVYWLSTEAAGLVTGQVLTLDGGWSLLTPLDGLLAAPGTNSNDT